MAESKKTENKEKMYTVTLPIIKGVHEDKVVVINGYRYIIKRGEPVEVPQSVYEVLQHEALMQRKQAEYEAELERRRKARIAE